MNRKVVGALMLLSLGVAAIIAYKLALPHLSGKPAGLSETQTRQTAPVAARADDAVTISIASSNTKEEWLGRVTEAFNQASRQESKWQVHNRPIQVEIIKETVDGKQKDYRSGTMVKDTLKGKIKPTILSPGSESWIETFEKEWQSQYQVQPVSHPAPVIVKTPVVIAMWRSRAKALGCYPQTGDACTWENIKKLAVAPEGWSLFNRPEWGDFTFGYGAYGESNSGTMGVLSMCMVGCGKQAGLVLADVENDNACGKFIAAMETAKVHSGKSDIWLLERMIAGGQNYLDAVITYESNVIDMNRKHGAAMPEPLVSVYPRDGTVFVGHPFAILDKTPWVTPEQTEAARVYQAYLLAEPQQKAVLEMGLRPVNKDIALTSPISEEYGADPKADLRTLEIPQPLVMDRLGEVWHGVKKKSVVVIAFDKSGSMKDGNKIAAARMGAKEFVKLMGDEDILVWLPFDDKIYSGRTQGPKFQVGEDLVDDINAISAGGGTALYDTILQARRIIVKYQSQYGRSMRYGLVVLSDGRDTAKGSSLAKVEADLMPQEHNPAGIQIHTVCIGKDCDEPVLRKIANAAHGRFWKGQTEKEMIQIYGSIATHY